MQKPGPPSSHSIPCTSWQPTILVGVTHPQTCLILSARLRTFRQAGFRVLLVSGPGELLDATAEREGVEPIAIPMQRKIAPLADVVSFFRLWLLLVRRRPDIVEFSTPKAGLLGTLAARLCGVSRRVYLLRGLKCETATGMKRRILFTAERLAASCAHVVLCNSESLRDQALANGIAKKCKLRLLGEGSSNGVDVKRFSPGSSDVRAKLSISQDAKVIGFVGRFTRDKGLPELITAFDTIARAVPAARLLLVGWFDAAEDALQNDLRTRILRHPAIDCTGFVADTASYYRAMDVLVLPTWREGFPNAVLEASATGIPVVSTESTGSRDSVIPEVTGLLVPPGYPDAISEAVLKIICDPERQHRMGQAARAWIIEHYLESRVLGRTAQYYRRLVHSAPAVANQFDSARAQ